MKVFGTSSLLVSLLLLVSLTGCTINLGGCGANEKYERVVELSEAIEPDSKLSAQTWNGAILVTGSDEEGCDVIATITARSFTQEEAQQLAEQTQVRLEQTEDGLKTVIDRPNKKNRESISVKLEIRVPHATALSLGTSNGKIEIISTKQAIDAKTSNGKITITDATGAINAHTSNGRIEIKQADAERFDLHTSNGKIYCEAITGDIKASTSNGAIDVVYQADANPATNIDLTTSNGSISVTTPENYSAQVNASTSNSKIHTSLPIMVQGEFGKKINGTIGEGEGQLTLRTSNGAIHIQ